MIEQATELRVHVLAGKNDRWTCPRGSHRLCVTSGHGAHVDHNVWPELLNRRRQRVDIRAVDEDILRVRVGIGVLAPVQDGDFVIARNRTSHRNRTNKACTAEKRDAHGDGLVRSRTLVT